MFSGGSEADVTEADVTEAPIIHPGIEEVTHAPQQEAALSGRQSAVISYLGFGGAVMPQLLG